MAVKKFFFSDPDLVDAATLRRGGKLSSDGNKAVSTSAPMDAVERMTDPCWSSRGLDQRSIPSRPDLGTTRPDEPTPSRDRPNMIATRGGN